MDGWLIVGSALWVSGLALLLATFSYQDWRAARAGKGTERVGPPFAWGYEAGGSLFCVGLLLASRTWLERAAWGVGLLLVIWRWLRPRALYRDDGTRAEP